MPRISESHLEEVKRYLDFQLGKIETLKRLVLEKGYSWVNFPEPKKGKVYAVDGSRMIKRLSGAIIYAVSSVAIGEDLLQWHEIGLVSPYKHVDERIRLHMETLESRIGAMTRDIKGADLILMDGTLSGSIARPPAYINGTSKELYEGNKIDFLDTLRAFLELLEGEWERWKEELEKGALINHSTIIARRENLFEYLKERTLDPSFIGEIEQDPTYRENLVIFLEYVEYLHALDKLLGGQVAFIAKTFYTDDVVRSATADKEEHALMPDVPILDAISKERGYFPFEYHRNEKGIKWSLPEPIKKLQREGYLRNIAELFKKEPAGAITPAYVRFVNGGVVYLMETLNLDEELLGLILGVSEDEYVIPLEYAHHSVVIKKQEFDTYVDSIVNALVGEDERYLSFLRYGREPLE